MTLNGCFHLLDLLNTNKIKKRIKKNEGYRNKIYYDQLGYATIGYGHLVRKNEKFLKNKKYTKKYLTEVFEKDFKKTLSDFKLKYKNTNLQKNTKEVLIEMIFQLGLKNTANFKKFNKHLKEKKIYLAAIEMLDSLWYLQTPKRVEILMGVLLNFKNDKKKQ